MDVELFRLGWHSNPPDLRSRLQSAIDIASDDAERHYDAIVLAYGLCGRATDGLIARRVPLVIPRAHDCITLFLGGRTLYQQQFSDHPGTYWYVRDYVERKTGSTALSLGADGYDDVAALYDEYVIKYGKDNADYLMEVMGRGAATTTERRTSIWVSPTVLLLRRRPGRRQAAVAGPLIRSPATLS